jgi:hypothetical protein
MIGAALLAASLTCSVAAQTEGQRVAGILTHLTAADHSQAMACGRSGAECAVVPYQLCPSEIGGRYSAQLATPFSRVAKAAFEGARSGRPVRRMERGAANQWGTGIYVFPAERSVNADAIQRMEIRREGRVIQPLTTTVAPMTATQPHGTAKLLTRGYFGFASEAFAPSADVTIVFIGSSGTTTCTLDREHLQAIR